MPGLKLLLTSGACSSWRCCWGLDLPVTAGLSRFESILALKIWVSLELIMVLLGRALFWLLEKLRFSGFFRGMIVLWCSACIVFFVRMILVSDFKFVVLQLGWVCHDFFYHHPTKTVKIKLTYPFGLYWEVLLLFLSVKHSCRLRQPSIRSRMG